VYSRLQTLRMKQDALAAELEVGVGAPQLGEHIVGVGEHLGWSGLGLWGGAVRRSCRESASCSASWRRVGIGTGQRLGRWGGASSALRARLCLCKSVGMRSSLEAA
jgi:hypothetical protein